MRSGEQGKSLSRGRSHTTGQLGAGQAKFAVQPQHPEPRHGTARDHQCHDRAEQRPPQAEPRHRRYRGQV
jgi:hypothetical protein